MNKFSSKTLRNIPVSEMTELEREHLKMEVNNESRRIISRYAEEGQFLLAISQALREEAGRILYQEEAR